MKGWIGIDPGQAGAVSLIFENGTVAASDWVDERTMFRLLNMWSAVYDIQAVAIEKQHGMPGNSSKSDTTFQQHTGAWKCLVKLAGFEPIEVTPQQWMKRRVPAKSHIADKPSFLYVRRKYPYVELYGPQGGKKDGRSDAICVAEWCKENHAKT